MRPRWMRIVMFAPLAIAGFAAFVFVGGLVVMWLWNWLLPPIVGWREITFWQALGLLTLCRILFGGFGGGHRHGRRWKGGHISDEERARFKQRMRERFGCDAPASERADNGAM
jgi:hypothetical protein